MTRYSTRLTLLLMAILASGCSANYTLKKVETTDQETPGIRFALPVRLIVAEPQPNGSLAVKVVYLPDPDNTFAATSRTHFAKNTFTVKVANGLLTDFGFNSDTSTVPAKLIDSAAAVRAERVKADAKTETTAKIELEKLDEEIRKAALAVEQAKEEYKVAQEVYGAEIHPSVFKARVALEKAKLALESLAKKQLALFVASDAVQNNPNSAPTTAFGPKFYRIVEDYDEDGQLIRVALKPVAQQLELAVRTGAEAATTGCPWSDEQMEIRVQGESSDPNSFAVEFSFGDKVGSGELEIENADLEIVVNEELTDGDAIRIELQGGAYTVRLTAINGHEDCSSLVDFELAN